MPKVKTSELTGPALDWAVDIADGLKLVVYIDALLGGIPMDGTWVSGYYSNPNHWVKVGSKEHKRVSHTSQSWMLAGPIIEREGLPVHQIQSCDGKLWKCCNSLGSTPLIAAMRCFVASRLGDEVDVPEELA